ncbi:MAG: hypothetical protein Q7V53_06155 [Caldisericota bacterium]|nr:hypothetical protein [Caldisericota bacterium]
MCGGGPKGPSAEEIAAQTRANKELVDAETKKINDEREAQKEKEAQKVLADQTAMATADQQRKQRQQTLLGGILEEDDDTLPDGTAAPAVADKPKSKKKSKTILQSLGE